MPHWWVPLRPSKPAERKKKTEEKLGADKVESFWANPGEPRCYALVRNCNRSDLAGLPIPEGEAPIELKRVD